MSAHKKTGANYDPSSKFSLTLLGDFARTTRRCKSDLTQANRVASIDRAERMTQYLRSLSAVPRVAVTMASRANGGRVSVNSVP